MGRPRRPGLRLPPLAVASLLLLAGCGSDSTPPPAPEPAGYPVAWRLPRAAVARLPAGDARSVIEDEGEVVARSKWRAYPGFMLLTWLQEERGVDLLEMPRDVDAPVVAVGHEQELMLVVLTGEHRRHAAALARIDPPEAELRRFYEDFNDDRWPEAGAVMRAWLPIFRRAVREVGDDTVVVIPIDD